MTYTEMKNEQDLMQVIGQMDFEGITLNFYRSWEQPIFLVQEIAECVDYTKSSDGTYNTTQLLKLCPFDSMKMTFKIYKSSKTRNMKFVTEQGLYIILGRCNTVKAEPFLLSVSNKLTQIRKTGGYIPVSAEDTEEMIEQRAKEIASKTIAIKDEIIAQLQAENENLQAEVDFHKEDVKDCERLIDVLCDDVKYLFNDTDFGVHSISDAYTIMSHNVNGSRKFVKWFNERNEKVEVIDVYVDDNGSRIKNAIDLSDINVFHDFKDLVFAYQQEQQGFTRK